MTETVFHQMLMLRPMRAGIGGYARLQGEAGRQLVQIHLRGLEGGSMRVFWYAGEGLVRELGSSPANPRGEAGLYTELADEGASPRRLAALLITDGKEKPLPLAIGLCTAQSAGSLLDAKNALLALCERLGREAAQREEQRPVGAANGGNRAAGADSGEGVAPGEGSAAAIGGAGSGEGAAPGEGSAAPGSGTGSGEGAAPGEGSVAPGNRSAAPGGGTESPGGKASGRAVGTEDGIAAAPGGRTAFGAPRPERRSGTDGSGKAAAGQVPREVFLPAIDVHRERRRSRRETVQEELPAPQDATLLPRQENSETAPGKTNACGAATSRHTGTPFRRDPVPAADRRKQPVPSPAGNPPAPVQPRRAQGAPPADRLPALHWPEPFGQVAAYFERLTPMGLPGWPGWRFVEAKPGAEGLWIGAQRSGMRVEQVAYVLPDGAPLPPGRPFRRIRAADGAALQVLVMKA